MKSSNEDIDMKSATSVCSMDFNVVDLTRSHDTPISSTKTTTPSIPKHNASEKSSTTGTKSSTSSISQPITTVQVVNDSVVDLTGDDDEKLKEEPKKQPTKAKKDADKPPKKKKTTISEDTKMKIRDSIFASMLAKQKGKVGADVLFLMRFDETRMSVIDCVKA